MFKVRHNRLLADRIKHWLLHLWWLLDWARRLVVVNEQGQNTHLKRRLLPVFSKRFPEFPGGLQPPAHWLAMVRGKAPHLLQSYDRYRLQMKMAGPSKTDSNHQKQWHEQPLRKTRIRSLFAGKPAQWLLRLSHWFSKKNAVASSKSQAETVNRLPKSSLGTEPPDHWVAMVREKAPHLLQQDPGRLQTQMPLPPQEPQDNCPESADKDHQPGYFRTLLQRLKQYLPIWKNPIPPGEAGENNSAGDNAPVINARFGQQVLAQPPLSEEDSLKYPSGSAPGAGPPDHWVAMVREKAPHMLQHARPTAGSTHHKFDNGKPRHRSPLPGRLKRYLSPGGRKAVAATPESKNHGAGIAGEPAGEPVTAQTRPADARSSKYSPDYSTDAGSPGHGPVTVQKQAAGRLVSDNSRADGKIVNEVGIESFSSPEPEYTGDSELPNSSASNPEKKQTEKQKLPQPPGAQTVTETSVKFPAYPESSRHCKNSEATGALHKQQKPVAEPFIFQDAHNSNSGFGNNGFGKPSVDSTVSGNPVSAGHISAEEYSSKKFSGLQGGINDPFQPSQKTALQKTAPTPVESKTRTQNNTGSLSGTETACTICWPPLRGEKPTEDFGDSLWPELRSDSKTKESEKSLADDHPVSTTMGLSGYSSTQRKQRELAGELWNG